MRLKSHPLLKANPGDILAIVTGSGEYGYVRVYRGRSLGVIPVISTGLVTDMEKIRQHKPRWFFDYVVISDDEIEMLKVGEIPFASQREAWPPPRFDPPSIFMNSFRIEEFGGYRRATEAETVGLQQVKRLTPETLHRLIRDHASECLRLQGSAKFIKRATLLCKAEDGKPERNVVLEIVFRANDFPFKGRDVPEDALSEALKKAKLGEVIGGGTSPHTSDIVVEVADLLRGLRIVRKTLRRIGAPASTEIHCHRPKHEIYRLE